MLFAGVGWHGGTVLDDLWAGYRCMLGVTTGNGLAVLGELFSLLGLATVQVAGELRIVMMRTGATNGIDRSPQR